MPTLPAAPVALVTGAASGVGAATVQALADSGARVAVCDVSPAGDEVAARTGGLFVPLDVSDPGAWADAVATIEAALGPVDLVHLNAGIMTSGPTEPIGAAMDLAALDGERVARVIAVNVGGVLNGLRALVPGLQGRGGAIVATASTAGLIGYPLDPVYSMTKHAVVGLVRSAAPVLRASGVRLQALCPGGIDTPLIPDYGRQAGIGLLQPSQVAAAVADLLLAERDGAIFTIHHDRPEAVPVPDPDVPI